MPQLFKNYPQILAGLFPPRRYPKVQQVEKAPKNPKQHNIDAGFTISFFGKRKLAGGGAERHGIIGGLLVGQPAKKLQFLRGVILAAGRLGRQLQTQRYRQSPALHQQS